MQKLLMLVGILTALLMGTPAYADGDGCSVPMSQWQSRDAVQNMAQAQGWDVRRIKIDDGCYEIEGFDASGREIEVMIDPATLEIIELEYEDDEHKEDENDEYTITSSSGVASSTSLGPSNKGLFTQVATLVVASQKNASTNILTAQPRLFLQKSRANFILPKELILTAT